MIDAGETEVEGARYKRKAAPENMGQVTRIYETARDEAKGIDTKTGLI
jgi:hypothetical protein